MRILCTSFICCLLYPILNREAMIDSTEVIISVVATCVSDDLKNIKCILDGTGSKYVYSVLGGGRLGLVIQVDLL